MPCWELTVKPQTAQQASPGGLAGTSLSCAPDAGSRGRGTGFRHGPRRPPLHRDPSRARRRPASSRHPRSSVPGAPDTRQRWPRPPSRPRGPPVPPLSSWNRARTQPRAPERRFPVAGTGTPSPPREQGGTHLRTAGPPGPAGTGTRRPAGCPPSRGPPCPRAPEPRSRKVRGPAARAANSPQRSARRPPSRSTLGPQRRRAPGGGKQGWAGPADATPRAPQPPNRLPPGLGAAPLAWVVVGADWLWWPTPRPTSDRVTWKHKTRLRPLVVELSAGSKPQPSADEEEAGEAGLRPPSPHARAPERCWAGLAGWLGRDGGILERAQVPSGGVGDKAPPPGLARPESLRETPGTTARERRLDFSNEMGEETQIAAPWVKKGKVYSRLRRLSSGKQREALRRLGWGGSGDLPPGSYGTWTS